MLQLARCFQVAAHLLQPRRRQGINTQQAIYVCILVHKRHPDMYQGLHQSVHLTCQAVRGKNVSPTQRLPTLVRITDVLFRASAVASTVLSRSELEQVVSDADNANYAMMLAYRPLPEDLDLKQQLMKQGWRFPLAAKAGTPPLPPGHAKAVKKQMKLVVFGEGITQKHVRVCCVCSHTICS